MPIEPDTKDWTWVLERPCPECGFDASGFPREQTGPMLRENAAGWVAELGRRAEQGDVADRPGLGTDHERWSPLEYACHVRDVCRLYDVRLHLMLDQDDPLFQNWDQDASAVDDRYHEQDPATVATDLAAAAHQLADSFDRVAAAGEDDPSIWARPGRRSDGAGFTIESFARYFVHDPIHHLRFDLRSDLTSDPS